MISSGSNKIIQKPNYSDYSLDLEISNVKGFLKSEKLDIDEKFLLQIAAGDIIEIYSFPENKQIYSNSEFKKLCSYSDEQMQKIPFPTLFWREDQVHMNLMKRAAEVVKLPKDIYSWNIEPHELVENLHPRKRTFEINVKNIAPCFCEATGAPVAWISTLQVEFIFEWAKDISD